MIYISKRERKPLFGSVEGTPKKKKKNSLRTIERLASRNATAYGKYPSALDKKAAQEACHPSNGIHSMILK